MKLNGFLKQIQKTSTAIFAAGALLGSFAVSSGANAGDGPGGFPKRQITIIVCFGAGGGSDQMARAMGAAAEKVLGVPVVVTNKKGAGGLGCMPDFLGAPACDENPVENIAEGQDQIEDTARKDGQAKEVAADKPGEIAFALQVPIGHWVEWCQVDDLGIGKDSMRHLKAEAGSVESEKSVLLFDEVKQGQVGHGAPEPGWGKAG